jgi:hypothetical protein
MGHYVPVCPVRIAQSRQPGDRPNGIGRQRSASTSACARRLRLVETGTGKCRLPARACGAAHTCRARRGETRDSAAGPGLCRAVCRGPCDHARTARPGPGDHCRGEDSGRAACSGSGEPARREDADRGAGREQAACPGPYGPAPAADPGSHGIFRRGVRRQCPARLPGRCAAALRRPGWDRQRGGSPPAAQVRWISRFLHIQRGGTTCPRASRQCFCPQTGPACGCSSRRPPRSDC